MNYISKIGDKEFKINLIENSNGQLFVKIDNETIPVQIIKSDSQHIYSALIGNRSYELEIKRNETDYLIHFKGNHLKIMVEEEKSHQLKQFTRQKGSKQKLKELKAPMPGLIVAIEVKKGQTVRPGDSLLSFEAMKMENEIRASFEAVVKEIKVKKKQPVEKDQVLILFE